MEALQRRRVRRLDLLQYERRRASGGKAKKGEECDYRRGYLYSVGAGRRAGPFYQKIKAFRVGGFYVRAFRVPHNMPCVGFNVYIDEDKEATFAYDFRRPSDEERGELVSSLVDLGIFVIEANYDDGLIMGTSVDSSNDINHIENARDNHLSNFDTVKPILDVMDTSLTKPRKVVLAHMSTKHNKKSVAKSIVEDAIRRTGNRIPVFIAPHFEDNKTLKVSI